MIRKEYANGSLVLYDSIKSLPITRYNSLNKYAIQQAGIGSSMQDVVNHFSKIASHLQRKEVEEAALELENLHYNFFLGLNGVNIQSRVFLCFVREVNGKAIIDAESDLEYESFLKDISAMGITQNEMELLIADVKKKLLLS